MTIKPILDVLHRGRRITVQFAARQKTIAMKYDVFLNNEPVEVDLFAEEVMRWLADVMADDPGESENSSEPPTT
jgi:hypothetical protein